MIRGALSIVAFLLFIVAWSGVTTGLHGLSCVDPIGKPYHPAYHYPCIWAPSVEKYLQETLSEALALYRRQ